VEVRVESDPIDLPVAALERVMVSIHLPTATPVETFHWDGRQTATFAPGDHTADAEMTGGTTTTARPLPSAIQVDAPMAAGTVVVLGDSITDGNGTTIDADTRWPDFLAARLAPRNVAVSASRSHPSRAHWPARRSPTTGNREKDALRAEINRWIRTSNAFDAVLDADSLLQDPAHPARPRADVDSGDHLHPGDRGNAALAGAVELDAL
jgi:hypothetical protein